MLLSAQIEQYPKFVTNTCNAASSKFSRECQKGVVVLSAINSGWFDVAAGARSGRQADAGRGTPAWCPNSRLVVTVAGLCPST